MIKFEDGPAHAVFLMLRQAPKYLRVTLTLGQGWDALDQVDDSPRETEMVYAYERIGEAGWAHVLNRREKHKSGVFASATYRYVKDQPEDVQMRNNSSWELWCRQRAAQEADHA